MAVGVLGPRSMRKKMIVTRCFNLSNVKSRRPLINAGHTSVRADSRAQALVRRVDVEVSSLTNTMLT